MKLIKITQVNNYPTIYILNFLHESNIIIIKYIRRCSITLGVYKIENTVNNKSYIGKSNDIERRWLEHTESLNTNSHHSYKLQTDWNKYGKNNFTFEILEEIDKTLQNTYKTQMLLIYVEDKYMKQYNSISNGYNIENTMQEVLNGNRIIMNKDLDWKYLKTLIRNGGITEPKKSKKKKKGEIDPNVKSCITIYQELLSEDYILDFSKTTLHNILASVNIFYRENNSFYVHKEYIEEGYFINGKESKNQDGFKHPQILITEKGKQFIIDKLELKKKK